jgi:DNA-binding CsgD family transcriptional regulator
MSDGMPDYETTVAEDDAVTTSADPLFRDELWKLLTAQERKVAVRLAEAATNRQIARELKISVKTVDTHRGHLMKKLKCSNNAILTHLAIARGWVSIQATITEYGFDCISKSIVRA